MGEQEQPVRRGRGRPSEYDFALVQELCQRVSDGEHVTEILESDSRWPSWSTLMRWKRDHEEFQKLYAQARESWADHEFERILQISDDGTNDFRTRVTRSGDEIQEVDYDHIQRSRLRVDTRKWALGRLFPKKYGDRLELDTAPGANLGASMNVMVKLAPDDAAQLREIAHRTLLGVGGGDNG